MKSNCKLKKSIGNFLCILMIFFIQSSVVFTSFGQSLNAQKLTSMENNKKTLANKNYKYKATIYNTNFTIPAMRFNFSNNLNDSQGTVSFFNSIGAGIGKSRGEIREIRDANGDVFDQDFTNTFAWYLGFLFAADTGNERANVFAPMLSFVFLDLQIGIGYELGSIQNGNQRTFLTLGYNIPINKLKRGGYYIIKSSGIIDDTEFGATRLGK